MRKKKRKIKEMIEKTLTAVGVFLCYKKLLRNVPINYLLRLTFFYQNVKMMETRKPKIVSGFPNGGLNAGKNY